MPERGEWVQIIIFIVFLGLAIGRHVLSAWLESRRGDAPRPRSSSSPGVQLLEKLREENERPATAERRASSSSSSSSSSSAQSGRRDESTEDLVYDDGSDEEDSFLGDDDLGSGRGMSDDSFGRRAPTRENAPRTSALGNQYALDWEDVADDTRRQGPPPPPVRSSRRRAQQRPNLPQDRPLVDSSRGGRSVLDPGASTPVGSGSTLSRVTHPQTEHVRTEHVRTERVQSGVSDPRTASDDVGVYREFELSDTAADLGMSQIPRSALGVPGVMTGRDLSSPLLKYGMNLRQALIGQILLGPPRAHQGPHRPGGAGTTARGPSGIV